MNCEVIYGRLHIKEGVTRVIVPDSFNGPINVGDIPSSVTVLTFGKFYNQVLVKGVIPPSVTHLTFGRNYDQVLRPGVIPSSVTHLEFGAVYLRQIEIGVIPSSVTHLVIYPSYVGSNCYMLYRVILVPGVIPSSVTHLKTSLAFSHQIEKGAIPSSVIKLILVGHNGFPENGVIPSSVTKLYWDCFYHGVPDISGCDKINFYCNFYKFSNLRIDETHFASGIHKRKLFSGKEVDVITVTRKKPFR